MGRYPYIYRHRPFAQSDIDMNTDRLGVNQFINHPIYKPPAGTDLFMIKALMTHPTQSLIGLLLMVGLFLAGLYFYTLVQDYAHPNAASASTRQVDSTGSLGLQEKHPGIHH